MRVGTFYQNGEPLKDTETRIDPYDVGVVIGYYPSGNPKGLDVVLEPASLHYVEGNDIKDLLTWNDSLGLASPVGSPLHYLPTIADMLILNGSSRSIWNSLRKAEKDHRFEFINSVFGGNLFVLSSPNLASYLRGEGSGFEVLEVHPEKTISTGSIRTLYLEKEKPDNLAIITTEMYL